MVLDSMTELEILKEMSIAWDTEISDAGERIFMRNINKLRKIKDQEELHIGDFTLPVRGTKYLYGLSAKNLNGEIFIKGEYLITVMNHDNNGGKYILKTGTKKKTMLKRTSLGQICEYVSKYEGHFFQRVKERLCFEDKTFDEIVRYYFRNTAKAPTIKYILSGEETGEMSFLEVGEVGLALGKLRYIKLGEEAVLMSEHYKTFVSHDMRREDQEILDMDFEDSLFDELQYIMGTTTFSSKNYAGGMYIDVREELLKRKREGTV